MEHRVRVVKKVWDVDGGLIGEFSLETVGVNLDGMLKEAFKASELFDAESNRKPE